MVGLTPRRLALDVLFLLAGAVLAFGFGTLIAAWLEDRRQQRVW